MGVVIGCLFITFTRILTHPDMVGEGVRWSKISRGKNETSYYICYKYICMICLIYNREISYYTFTQETILQYSAEGALCRFSSQNTLIRKGEITEECLFLFDYAREPYWDSTFKYLGQVIFIILG